MPSSLFKGETALVTGSASSIGRGIALALAHEGAEVTLADIDAERNAETAALIADAGERSKQLTVDLSDLDGHKRLLDATGDTTFDMFVHSASPPRFEKDGVRTVDEAPGTAW